LQTGFTRTPGPSPDVLQVGVASDALAREVEVDEAVALLQTGFTRTPGPSPDVLQVGVASDALAGDVQVVNAACGATFWLSCSKYWC